MRICIFGAGAVGSHFAVRLALAGNDVSCVMRGPHLRGAKANGLRLRVGDAEFSAAVKASDDPAALGPQDLVISTLKANALGSLARACSRCSATTPPSCSPRTAFPGGTTSGCRGTSAGAGPWLSRPGGRLRGVVTRERIIGGVIFSSNEIVAPGIVVNMSPDRNMLLVGECDDRQRADRTPAGRARRGRNPIAVGRAIRETIWSKLLTNMSMSVLCSMTGQTARAVRDDPACGSGAAPARRGQCDRRKAAPGRQARHPHRPGARPQAVDPAGL